MGQQFFGNGSGSDANGCLASTRPAASAVIAETILGVKGVISVTRTVLVLDVRIITRTLVLIANQDGDGRARRRRELLRGGNYKTKVKGI